MDIPGFVRNGAALLLVLGCYACANAPAQTASDEPRSDKMYRTGSHIPVKDPESTASKTVDTQAVQDSMMRGSAGPSPKGQ